MSDHEAVTIDIHLGVETKNKKPRQVYLFKKGNIPSLKEDLNDACISLMNDFGDRSLEENWSLFKKAIFKAMESHIPTKMLKNGKDIPWMNTKIKWKIRKRKRLFNRAKKTDKAKDWEGFRNLRNSIRREIDEAQTEYIRGILNTENLHSAPKRFWSFVAHKQRD